MRFYIFTPPLLDACGCVLSRFKAVQGYFENTQKHEMQTGDILHMRRSREFPMTKNTRPLGKTGLSQANSSSFSSAWQAHYYSLTCPNQSRGENFIPKRRYPVIWLKVASSFRTCLHHNGANYGASYRNKPGWSPQLTLFKHGHKVWGAAQTCLCVWMYKSQKKDASYPVDFPFFLSVIAARRRKSKR